MAHGARKATVLDSYQRRLLTRAIDNGCPRWLLMTAINDLMMMGREFLFNCKDFINCNVNLCYHPATPVEPTTVRPRVDVVNPTNRGLFRKG